MNRHSRITRRAWVVALYAYLLVIVPLARYSDLPSWLSTALILGYVFAPLPGRWYNTRLNIWDKEPLDERQHALRNFAYRLGYQVMLFLAFTVMVSYWVSNALFGFTEVNSLIAFLVVMLFFAMLYLPLSIVAWLEPNPVPEDRFEERTLA